MSGLESPEDCQSKLTGGTERESTVGSVLVDALKSVLVDAQERLASSPFATLVLKKPAHTPPQVSELRRDANFAVHVAQPRSVHILSTKVFEMKRDCTAEGECG